MRILAALVVGMLSFAAPALAAEKDKEVVGGILSGLLGAPQQTPGQTYSAQERDRLVQLLSSGDYVTSRQGEPVDLIVYGVPLTQKDHVYSARPVAPSRTTYGQ